MNGGPVGFIGLGIMGRPMALNLLAAEVELIVHSRSPAPVAELVGAGAAKADTAAEVAAAAAVTILMLPDDAAVQNVVLGPQGVVEAVGSGDLVIDMSTVSPHLDRRLAEHLHQLDAELLDAPVSGGDAGAKAGSLSIMAGGPVTAFERARPLFEILGSTIVHVGDHGAGQVVKACNQIVVALTIEAVAEALVLGSKSGVSPETVIRVLSGGLAGSQVLDLRGPTMTEHRFTPGFQIALHHKDLGIALSEARQAGVSLPATALVDQMMTSVRRHGGERLDHSALLTHLERLSDHTIGGSDV
jgi:2-hydroxy-3-oxopropionate reductase